MKIAVFSDTHGYPSGMLAAVREYKPDCVIHLGDGADDTELIESEFPQLPIIAVAGNCDYDSMLPDKKEVTVGGIKMFLTHGHRYAVRYGKLDTLLYSADCSGAQIAMFGHTHRPVFDQIGGIFVLNPGTAGKGKPNTWAKLEIGPTGEIECEIVETPARSRLL